MGKIKKYIKKNYAYYIVPIFFLLLGWIMSLFYTGIILLSAILTEISATIAILITIPLIQFMNKKLKNSIVLKIFQSTILFFVGTLIVRLLIIAGVFA